jgi:hypothetical protein
VESRSPQPPDDDAARWAARCSGANGASADSRRGLWIIALSIIAAIGWAVALATGLVNPDSNTSM